MNIAFYYQNWDWKLISGTQDSIHLLCKQLNTTRDYNFVIIGDGLPVMAMEHYSTVPFINDEMGYRNMNTYDVVVFLSSCGTIDPSRITVPKMLWNHCWDYVEGVEKHKNLFDKIIALSPKHAKHLGCDDWCYNGYDPKMFYRTDAERINRQVVYCGGPSWHKGGKMIEDIRRALWGRYYDLKSVWGISQTELSKYFNESQFVLIPSAIESFSLVSVQAQACGCIPIANDVGGISETIPEGIRECLYSGNVINNIENAITLFGEFQNINTASAKCIENAKRFDISTTSEKFHELMYA